MYLSIDLQLKLKLPFPTTYKLASPRATLAASSPSFSPSFKLLSSFHSIHAISAVCIQIDGRNKRANNNNNNQRNIYDDQRGRCKIFVREMNLVPQFHLVQQQKQQQLQRTEQRSIEKITTLSLYLATCCFAHDFNLRASISHTSRSFARRSTHSIKASAKNWRNKCFIALPCASSSSAAAGRGFHAQHLVFSTRINCKLCYAVLCCDRRPQRFQTKVQMLEKTLQTTRVARQ